MPGHGRGKVDSHLELPRVSASAEELETDIQPFATLNGAPMAGMAVSLMAFLPGWVDGIDGTRPPARSQPPWGIFIEIGPFRKLATEGRGNSGGVCSRAYLK